MIVHLPGCRVPVRIVVTFFWALKTGTATARVLTSETSSSTSEALISKEEASIALTQLTILVVLIALVHTVLEGSALSIKGIGSHFVVGVCVICTKTKHNTTCWCFGTGEGGIQQRGEEELGPYQE